jgi:CRISPR-associated protein Csc1
MSKAELEVKELPKAKQSEGEFTFYYPLNPLDVMFSHQVISYDVVNMPPVSLIRNVRLQGQFYQTDKLIIPSGMQYRFRG